MLRMPLAAVTMRWLPVAQCQPAEHLNANTSRDNDTWHPQSRRRYSLERVDKPPDPRVTKWAAPWPWIQDCKQYQLRYCFEDDRTMGIMYMPMLQAIGLWSPAFDQNDVVILPDPSCSDEKCICDKDKIGADTIVVKLGLGWRAVIGYQYGHHAPGRHFIIGKEYDPVENHPSESDWDDYAAWCTAHEIGHLLGFIHEHQRPDAGGHVELNCPAMIGYGDALKNIESVKNEPEFAGIEDAAK